MTSITSQSTLGSLQERLAPAEELFFRWMIRVVLAAIFAGSAWIDDAPPLSLAAMLVAVYVIVRVITQFGRFMSAAPFQHRVLQTLFALVCIFSLLSAFTAVSIFVERIAISVV
ncbi:MAG: hypothetical protein MI746_15490 [Pseudomonadales bacterium]|nr:hypothetical protein [Pseudomonadales bacterium]